MQDIGKTPFLSAGIDYLRLTVKPGQKGLDECASIFTERMNYNSYAGHDMRETSLSGYRGHKCSSYFMGDNRGAMMFQVEGFEANSIFEALREVEFHGNVPRLDAESTIQQKEAGAKTVSQIRWLIKKRFAESKTKSCRKLALYEEATGGGGLSLGSRYSASVIRIYNAHAKHSDLYKPGAWRYEVEYHNAAAKRAWCYLRAAPNTTAIAKQLVVGKLQTLGIKEKWHSMIPPIAPMSGTKTTKDQQRIAWLRTQVAGVCRGLVERGFAEEIADALGIVSFELLPCIAVDNIAQEVFEREWANGKHSDTNGYA